MTEARPIEEVMRDPRSGGEIQRALDALDQAAAPVRARVHVLRNFTIENCLGNLRVAGYRRGVRIDVSVAPFDAYRQDALADASGDIAAAETVFVWLWLESLRPAFDASGRLDVEKALREVFDVATDVMARSKATVALHTFLPPMGVGSQWVDHDALDRLNAEIRARVAAEPRLVLVDTARIAAHIGFDQAIDARFSLAGSAPIAAPFARAWADAAAQSVAVRAGRVRKVIVVDADNTLWGGVVGEDGLEGIRLSEHAYPGNAYRRFHQQLLDLRASGVVLALASKNEPEAVLEVLDRHPASLLKREHFSAMRIGWQPKSESIRQIAEELGLGLESVVFVDDSAFECDEVSGALPMVETLRVPAEAHRVPALLASVRLFEAAASTLEDGLRAEHYAKERARDAARATHADLDSFLASLELEAVVGPPSAAEIDRVAQLTQRTNQFNLTTRRYDAGTIASMCASERFVVVALRARDRHGDYGLVGVGIAELTEGTARVDSLMLSCRALGRKLDDVLLVALLTATEERAPGHAVTSDFVPTAKNAQVARFFDERGFSPVRDDHDDFVKEGAEKGRIHYQRTAAERLFAPAYIKVTRISP